MNRIILALAGLLFARAAVAQTPAVPIGPGGNGGSGGGGSQTVAPNGGLQEIGNALSIAPNANFPNSTSVANHGIDLFGDSITAGLGATQTNPISTSCSSYACLIDFGFAQNVGPYNNYGISGITVGDIAAYEFLHLAPSVSSNPVVTNMGGTNDAVGYLGTSGYTTVYDTIQGAAYAWPSVSPTDTIAGNSSLISTTGTWTSDIVYAPNITGLQSTTNGSTACDASTTTNSGLIYAYYGIYNGQSVSGTATGYISGTTLTVTSAFVTGNIVAGATITGAGVTAGTHIVNGVYPTYTVDTSQTVGSAGSPISLSSSGGPYSSGGSFQVSIDGTPATETITGNTTLLSETSPAWGSAPGAPAFGRTVALGRFVTTPGTHSVCVSVTSATGASNFVNFLGFAIPPATIQRGTASPKLFAGGVIKWLNDSSYSAQTALANAQNQAMANLLSNDGLNVQFVDVRSFVNDNLDMTGTITQNCPASTNVGAHPNDCGHAHLAQAFENSINFGAGSPLGGPVGVSSIPNPTALSPAGGVNGDMNGTDPVTTNLLSKGTWCAATFGSYGFCDTEIFSTSNYHLFTAGNRLADRIGFSFAQSNATIAQILAGINFWIDSSGNWVMGPLKGDSVGTFTIPSQGTVPSCSSANNGQIRYFSDATTNVPGAVVASGSSLGVIGWCDGIHTVAWHVMGGTVQPTLSGLTGTIGGSALVAGACASGTVSVTGAATSMAVSVSGSAGNDPGGSFFTRGYVSAAGTVTVLVCAAVAGTPTGQTYNVRVIE